MVIQLQRVPDVEWIESRVGHVFFWRETFIVVIEKVGSRKYSSLVVMRSWNFLRLKNRQIAALGSGGSKPSGNIETGIVPLSIENVATFSSFL